MKVQQLLEGVMKFQTSQDIKVARIQLLGEIGAGKSSLLNSIASVLNNRISDIAITGKSDMSVTTTVNINIHFPLINVCSKLLLFHIFLFYWNED